jgi:hypothetical protein
LHQLKEELLDKRKEKKRKETILLLGYLPTAAK